jgi:glutathione S-transferase
MYTLHIANKNYSSWSLRPWALMRELRIPFTEDLIPFHRGAEWAAYRRIAPNGKVPCLVDRDITVWESLAIVEYLAERHAGVWPEAPNARAWSRSAAAEMHAGFGELRNRCPMNCGVRIRLDHVTAELTADLKRIVALWNDGLRQFGGPFLAGSVFTAVDAFFAPVVFRLKTYGLKLDPKSQDYAARMLECESLRTWYAEALREPFRDAPHDAEIPKVGTLLEDLRVPEVPDPVEAS